MTRAELKQGRPEPGRFAFDQAKQAGRNFALTETATILRDEIKQDEGGAPVHEWKTFKEGVPARLDAYPRAQPRGLVEGGIAEQTTHQLHIAPGCGVKVEDRIVMAGKTWVIMAIDVRTGEPTIRMEVREK